VTSKRPTNQLRARKLLAKRIREVRVDRGLSQESLAAATGLHRTYIGSVERAERNVSIDNIERIALALNCKVADLLTEDRR